MAPEFEPLERRVETATVVRRRPSKYTVVGYGPGRNRVVTERGIDIVKIGSGTRTEIRGVVEAIEIYTSVSRLFFRREVVPETGTIILHVTGG